MERRRLDAVLLEFDGVLADTAVARRDALLSVLREDGIVLREEDYDERCAGHATADAVRAAVFPLEQPFDETTLDLWALRAERAFSDHVGKGITLVDGAREAVERLASRVRIGLVGRARRRELDLVLSLAQIDHFFAFVMGSEDSYPPKPAPAPYQAALHRLGARRPIPRHGVVVALEGSAAGIRSARAAGLRCIAVGTLPAHFAMEADALLPSISDLGVEVVEQLVVRPGEQFQ